VTLGEALAWATAKLREAGVPEPETDAEWLLAHVLKTSRTALRLERERPLDEIAQKTYKELVGKRAKRMPLAYLLGEQPFCGLTLKVDTRVMIPRPETEQLVEVVAGWLQRLRRSRMLLADIGTGSGAIALALAARFEEATVYGVDISSDALQVAEENAQRLGLIKRCVFLHGDLTEPLKVIFPPKVFDAVVANLPYVAEREWEQLAPEVRCFEPAVAFRGGPDGLSLIDTFNDEKFEAIRCAEALGERLTAVRFDTPSSRRGDMVELLREVRWELDIRGYKHVKLFVSGGLDEYEILQLNEVADAYGVGTAISNAPTINFAMDIVEIEGKPIAKRGKMAGGERYLAL